MALRKTLSTLICLIFFFSICLADSEPNLPYDLNTTSACTFWYDNYQGFSCEDIATAYEDTFAELALWNPSLTTDCGNWLDGFSYCVEARVANATTTESTSTATSTIISTPTALPTWTSVGCYLDSASPPTLSNRTAVVAGDSGMTIKGCETACAGTGLVYAGTTYAGLEDGTQCWCGSYIANELANSTDCDTPCAGLATEVCGGSGRVNIYKGVYPSIITTTSSALVSATTTSTSSSAITTTSSSASATATGTHPIYVAGNVNFTLLGCYATPDSGVPLTGVYTNTALTVELCLSHAAGNAYAGVEFGQECWYGNTLFSGTTLQTTNDPCSTVCVGNTTESCGADGYLMLYAKK